MRAFVVLSAVIGFVCAQAGAASEQGAGVWKIVKQDGNWRLLRDGAPFYVKGAVGWQAYDLLGRSGGNAIRTGANRAGLDKVHEAGLVAMVNLSVRGERNGMNWDDEQMVSRQKQRVLQTVREVKDHPAVMCWAVGNELDWIPPGTPYSPRLWQRLNEIAAEIHAIDPDHPVLTVIGDSQYEQKIQEIARDCPDMDLLGINSYGNIAKLAELTRKHWPKPYVAAEWGPTGHWQVPKTAWRAPIEETSTEKARAIYDRYTKVIQADASHCLGSFVFLWAQKQETTHTWYGMFLDDLPTESVDVMCYLWSGAWPQNRAPAVLSLDITGSRTGGFGTGGFETRPYIKPGETYEAKVTCYDCDYDALTFKWDIRPEVEIPKNSYAGGGEKPAVPISGLIEEGQGAQIRFRAPQSEGAYRLFVQVLDGQGHIGYANAPFYVRQP